MSRLSDGTPLFRRVLQACCVVLIGLAAAPSVAQDEDGEEARESMTGTVVFEGLPKNLDNVGGTGFFWRVPAVSYEGDAAMPLSQMRVVLSHSSRKRDAEPQDLKIRGYELSPLTAVVGPGAALNFTNQSEPSVQLRAVGWSDIEPLVMEGKGDEASVTLEKPGRYLFRDTNSTSVLTYVIVTESVADAPLTGSAPREARFDLGIVQKGTYKLKVYFRGAMVLVKDVKISGDGSANQSQFLITGDMLRKALQRP